MADEEQDKYSVFSKTAYDFYYHDLEFAQNELHEYGYKDWVIDRDLSDKNSVVLTDNDNVVISYRGTDITNFSDLYTDANILIGRHRTPIPSQRFFEAESKYEKTKNKYENGNITLTGHSLGNTTALYVGRKHNVKSVGFNTGSSPADIAVGQACKFFNKCSDYEKHTLYTTGDLISYSSTFGKEKIVKVPVIEKKDWLNHSLTNFLPKKINKNETKLPVYLEPVPRLDKNKPPKYILNSKDCLSDPQLPQCKNRY
jgi:hypothetical protein